MRSQYSFFLKQGPWSLSGDVRKNLRYFKFLSFAGFFLVLGCFLWFIWRPLNADVVKTKNEGSLIEREIAFYLTQTPRYKISRSDDVPDILERCRLELEQNSILVDSFNVEKFQTKQQGNAKLGYALVRMHLSGTSISNGLKRLEELDKYRVTIEELELTQNKAAILLKIFFQI